MAYTDDYNQQMGLERLLYDAYPEAVAGASTFGVNKQVPVGVNHTFYNYFRELGVLIVESNP